MLDNLTTYFERNINILAEAPDVVWEAPATLARTPLPRRSHPRVVHCCALYWPTCLAAMGYEPTLRLKTKQLENRTYICNVTSVTGNYAYRLQQIALILNLPLVFARDVCVRHV